MSHPHSVITVSPQVGSFIHLECLFLKGVQGPGTEMAAPKRQDTRKFVENLSGEGKSIAVLTSGGDAQGNVLQRRVPLSDARFSVTAKGCQLSIKYGNTSSAPGGLLSSGKRLLCHVKSPLVRLTRSVLRTARQTSAVFPPKCLLYSSGASQYRCGKNRYARRLKAARLRCIGN